MKHRLPFVGNGIAFSKDIVGYIRECYKIYGPVFRMKIFRTEIVVICDRKLTDEYFNKKENDMSLYRVLDRLYFADAFADDPGNLDTIIRTVRNSVRVNFGQFAPKIMEEGYLMVERMRKEAEENGNNVNLKDQIVRFIARTSSRCFVSFEITDHFFELLSKFSDLLNKIVVLTYFVPKWLLRLIFNPFLRRYRIKMINLMMPTIQSYRTDPTKNESLVIRKALEMKIQGKDGKERGLNDREIGEILICLLYVSSENTALGLTSTLLDLANNPEYWKQVQETSKQAVDENNHNVLFSDRIIDACAMESARMNSHIFALNREPLQGINTLGDYFVGDVDCVALCEPMLMVYDAATDVFTDPETYNPDRFIVDGEKNDARSVMT